ncbi:hypothetical protein [Streptomyces sp. NPDC055990]|uniref:hypothetical protein n=1 Tax=Streptomyces sp. NPDC055990 TaxID=3345672 RepID=UPI0035D5D931
MRKWLAGWLSSLGYPKLADRIWPHYSERMRRAGRTFQGVDGRFWTITGPPPGSSGGVYLPREWNN